jgi:hypothetical protein
MGEGFQHDLVSAVCKHLDELIPFMEDRDCDEFLGLVERLFFSAKKRAKEAAERDKEATERAKEAAARASVLRTSSTRSAPVLAPPRKRGLDEDAHIAPWDLVAHAVLARVVSVGADSIIVEAKSSSDHKRVGLARVAFDQVSSIGKRQWPVLVEYFARHGLPAQLRGTPFGRRCSGMK